MSAQNTESSACEDEEIEYVRTPDPGSPRVFLNRRHKADGTCEILVIPLSATEDRIRREPRPTLRTDVCSTPSPYTIVGEEHRRLRFRLRADMLSVPVAFTRRRPTNSRCLTYLWNSDQHAERKKEPPRSNKARKQSTD